MNQVTVRRLVSADAEELRDCFLRCYGDTYPADVFYDVNALRDRIEHGRLRSVVAVIDGLVAGHTGLTVRYPESRAVEAGNTVVDPAFRGRGLLRKLGSALHQLCEELAYVGYLHYPTTAHEIMQKAAVSGTGRETGIMFGYVPSETHYENVETTQSGRLTTTVVYQPIADAPARDIFVPLLYAEFVGRVAGDLKLKRRLSSPTEVVDKSKTVLNDTLDRRRSLRSVVIEKIGSDFADLAKGLKNEAYADAVHVDILLDDPGVEMAVEALAQNGFMFCAWLPEFRHTDVLRMQLMVDPTSEIYRPALATYSARAIREMIVCQTFGNNG